MKLITLILGLVTGGAALALRVAEVSSADASNNKAYFQVNSVRPTGSYTTSSTTTNPAPPPTPPPLNPSGSTTLSFSLDIPPRNLSFFCYRDVFVGASINLSPTCTLYDEYRVATSYTDCGGCELRTVRLGPGPSRQCAVSIKLPVTTVTVTKCSPSLGSSGRKGPGV